MLKTNVNIFLIFFLLSISNGSSNTNLNQSTGDANGVTNEMERSGNDRNSLISSSSSSASTAPANDCAAANSPDSGLAIRNRSKRMRNEKASPSVDASANRGEDCSIGDTSSESNHLMNSSLPSSYQEHMHYHHSHHYPQQSQQQQPSHQHHHNNQYRTNKNHNNNNHLEISHSNSNNNSISNLLNSVNNNNVNSNRGAGSGNSSSSSGSANGHAQLQINGHNDVERHNQINKQLSASDHPLLPKFGGNRMSNSFVNYQNHMAHNNHQNSNHSQHGDDSALNISTIFPGRLINSNSNLNNFHRIQMQNQYYTPSDSVRSSSNANANSRSRTNPRSRQRGNTGNTLPYSYQNDNTYSYAEPIFRSDGVFDDCAPPLLGSYRTISSNRRPHHPNAYHHAQPFAVPDYQESNDRGARSSRNSRNMRNSNAIATTSGAVDGISRIQPIYSHDSSFGSDSGYSQYTQNSRSKSDGSNSSNGNSTTLSNMFSWARRKDSASQANTAGRSKLNTKPTAPLRTS